MLTKLALRAVPERWTTSRWTSEIKVAFTDLARHWCQTEAEWSGLFPCATGALERCGSCNADGEWMFDVTWLVYDPPASTRSADARLVAMPLALESEMSRDDQEDDDRDFLKLVIARAGLRVMVQRTSTPARAASRVAYYRELVRAFRGAAPGDRYLFAMYLDSSHTFAFEGYVHR